MLETTDLFMEFLSPVWVLAKPGSIGCETWESPGPEGLQQMCVQLRVYSNVGAPWLPPELGARLFLIYCNEKLSYAETELI